MPRVSTTELLKYNSWIWQGMSFMIYYRRRTSGRKAFQILQAFSDWFTTDSPVPTGRAFRRHSVSGQPPDVLFAAAFALGIALWHSGRMLSVFWDCSPQKGLLARLAHLRTQISGDATTQALVRVAAMPKLFVQCVLWWPPAFPLGVWNFDTCQADAACDQPQIKTLDMEFPRNFPDGQHFTHAVPMHCWGQGCS